MFIALEFMTCDAQRIWARSLKISVLNAKSYIIADVSVFFFEEFQIINSIFFQLQLFCFWNLNFFFFHLNSNFFKNPFLPFNVYKIPNDKIEFVHVSSMNWHPHISNQVLVCSFLHCFPSAIPLSEQHKIGACNSNEIQNNKNDST